MVFSAPEITTVSKPKRNPASADVSDQKKTRPFISGFERCLPKRRCDLQITRDQVRELRTLSLFGQRISFVPPVADAAVHRDHVGVGHLLQIVGCHRRAESASAVKHNLCAKLRHASLDVAFDDALTQMNRAGKMILGKLTLFANVYQNEFLAAIQLLLY